MIDTKTTARSTTHRTPRRRAPVARSDSATRFWDFAYDLGGRSESERVTIIKRGFKADWADAIKREFELQPYALVHLLSMSATTYERRRRDHKPLDITASERLDRIADIALAAESVFEDKDAASQWMSTPNQALAGDSPIMRCETEIGARQVRRILNALEWGGVA